VPSSSNGIFKVAVSPFGPASVYRSSGVASVSLTPHTSGPVGDPLVRCSAGFAGRS